MLTFFEYLRQRAFESVLAGAQEALELLELQQNRSQPKKQLPSGSTEPGTGNSQKPPRKREQWQTPTGPTSAPTSDDKPQPGPRDHGLAKHQAKGTK